MEVATRPTVSSAALRPLTVRPTFLSKSSRAASLVRLVLAATAAMASSPGTATARPLEYVCNQGASGPERRLAADRRIVLPDQDLFSAPIVGSDEPRISLGYVQTHLSGAPAVSAGDASSLAVGVVSAGAVVGLWGERHNCGGFQVGLLAGVFSQFDMDTPSQDLINSDFVVGLQFTRRRGPRSLRLRAFHQSSHLGDEFLLRNPSVERKDFGFQAVDGLVSFERDWWRVYGGGGAEFFNQASLAPGLLRGGGDLAGRATRGGRPRPVAAADVAALQALHWRPAVTAAGGLEWASPTGARQFRILVVFFDGFTPYGQFFDQQKMRHLGLQFQFEL